MDIDKLRGMTITDTYTRGRTLTIQVEATSGRRAKIIIPYDTVILKPLPNAGIFDDFISALKIIHEEDK